jgi:ABC-type antimicrobial peptide transport system permease subunit
MIAVEGANFVANRVVVRTAGTPVDAVGEIRRVIATADPLMRMNDIATIEEGLEQYVANPRFYTLLMGTFSLIALVIAAVGIYGVAFYSIARRTREIGVRMALGASRQDIMWSVLRQGFILTSIGVAVGLAGAWLLTRYLETLLFGVTPTDGLTFALASALLSIVSFVAMWHPARRATRVDPLAAIRYE